MSNRQVLFLLMALTVAAFAGRWWSAGYLERWETAVSSHKDEWQQIYETCDDLERRRVDAPKSSDEQSFRKHFQTQAFAAKMGTIDVTVRESDRRGYLDKTFTISFAADDPAFNREKLRLFLYNSELLYPRVRTTVFSIEPAPADGRVRSGVDTGAERDDLWRVNEIEFTQRSLVAQEE